MSSYLSNTGFGFFSASSGGGGSSSSKICSIPSGSSILNTSDRMGYNTVIYNFSITDCTNYYAGTLVAVWNPTTAEIQFTETATSSIGDTSGVSFSFSISGNSVNLIVTVPTSSWKFSYTKSVLQDCCTNPYVSGQRITTEASDPIVTEDYPSEEIITNLGDFLVDNLGNIIITSPQTGNQYLITE